MDTRRIAIALVVALVVSVGASYFFYVRVKEQKARTQTVKVVAAKSALRAGTQLSADNLIVVDWPSNIPMAHTFSKAEDVVGRPLMYPVEQNQPILETDVAVAGSGLGLTVRIPEGMRAVSVRSNEIVGVAGFLYPGSRVDVLVTYRPEGQNESPLTQNVLQNVEVLSAGQKIEPDPQGKPETVNVVTLLLTPEDSSKLVLATQQGTVQFVLRNGVDSAKADVKPVRLAELIGGPKAAPAPKPVVKPVPVKKAEFYEIETIAGEKRTTQKF